MAVNSFNPRLFSSSSSENDLDDVFRHKGGAAVVPVGGSLPAGKSRCFSEPVYQNGKEGKSDSTTVGKTPALSDSSNVLRRQRGRVVTLPEEENLDEGKPGCSTIQEELLQLSGNSGHDKTTTDSVFPEPEHSREAIRDDFKLSVFSEEEEELHDAAMPNLSRTVEYEVTGLVDFFGVSDNGGIDGLQEFSSRDIVGSSDGAVGMNMNSQNNVEDDDDSYPEKEFYPSNYGGAQDPPYVSYPWDVPRTVLRSCALDSELELPDNLFKDTAVYPDLMKHFGNLSPAASPPPISPINYEARMKLIFGEDY